MVILLELRLVGCGFAVPLFASFFVSERDADAAVVLAVQDFSNSLISFRDKDRPVPS